MLRLSVLLLTLLLFSRPGLAQSLVGQGKYLALGGFGNPTTMFWAAGPDGQHYSLGANYGSVICLDKDLEKKWKVSSLESGEYYVGEMYASQLVEVFTYHPKKGILSLKKHDPAQKGKVVESQSIGTFAVQKDSREPVCLTQADHQQVHFLAYHPAAGGASLRVEYIGYNRKEGKAAQPAGFTIPDASFTVTGEQVANGRILVGGSLKGKNDALTPVLYVYDLAQQQLKRVDLESPSAVNPTVVPFANQQTMGAILHGEDAKAYTKYVKLALVSAQGDLLTKEALPFPAGQKGRFLGVQHLLDLPNGGFCLLMESNAGASGSRYANSFTQGVMQELRSFQSGNISYTVLTAEGKVGKSGVIEKEQKQVGYMGNDYNFLSHSVVVTAEQVLVFYNKVVGEPTLKMAAVDFAGNLSAQQAVSGFSPKEPFHMFSNLIKSDGKFAYLVAYGKLIGYPNVHKIQLPNSNTSSR